MNIFKTFYIFSLSLCINAQAMQNGASPSNGRATTKPNMHVLVSDCSSKPTDPLQLHYPVRFHYDDTPDKSPDTGAVFPASPAPACAHISQRRQGELQASPETQTMEEVSIQGGVLEGLYPEGSFVRHQNLLSPWEIMHANILAKKKAAQPLSSEERIKAVATFLRNEREAKEALKAARQQLPKNTALDRANFLWTSESVQSITPCTLALCCPCYVIGTACALPCIAGYVCCHCQSNPCDDCCPPFSDDAD